MWAIYSYMIWFDVVICYEMSWQLMICSRCCAPCTYWIRRSNHEVEKPRACIPSCRPWVQSQGGEFLPMRWRRSQEQERHGHPPEGIEESEGSSLSYARVRSPQNCLPPEPVSRGECPESFWRDAGGAKYMKSNCTQPNKSNQICFTNYVFKAVWYESLYDVIVVTICYSYWLNMIKII